MTPTPAPTPPALDRVVHDVVGSLLDGIWLSATRSPALTAIAAVAIVIAVGQSVRRLRWSLVSRDPRRRFSGPERGLIFRRAGGRCEHHAWLLGRCSAREHLEADHVHPHSRGGQTNVANAQALCARHNRRKGARVPYALELRRLARRRQSYFPPDMPRDVVRRAARPRRQLVTYGQVSDANDHSA